MSAAEVGKGDRSGHPGTQCGEPDSRTRGKKYAIGTVEFPGVQAGSEPRTARSVRVVRHQQLVCAALSVLDERTVPSLVVIEQLSLLTKNRLDAWTEPTSDCEIGVTVSDHGM